MDIGFLEEFAMSLGFGKISNLNLRGESKGIVPSKLWKLKHLASLWYVGDSANFMIGQGYLLCNSLQLCTAVASIASGSMINLSLLESETQNKIIIPNKIVSEKNFKIVREAMFNVVNSQGGTGYNSIGLKYKNLGICGKTGTVQVSSGKKDKNHSVFVGFAPFDNPRYAVSIVGEFMGFGASFAAPLAGKIFDFLK
jgi:penicillin-binding protein 2